MAARRKKTPAVPAPEPAPVLVPAAQGSRLYVPHRWQAEIESRLKRFSVLVCHRRFGKTVLSVNRLIAAALATERPDWRGAYIAPTYKQAKTVVWDYLKRYLGPDSGVEGARFSETELRADLPGGARIRLLGANDPDSLRGVYLDGAVFDEVAQMPLRVWSEVIRPALADRRGWALFIGTPQGRNVFWDLWRRAQRDPDWYGAMYRAGDTGLLDPDELAAARREMSAEEYEQEFECSFSAAVRGAYFGGLVAELERGGAVAAVPHEPELPVHTAWDLGMSDSTAIWFFQAAPGGEFRIIDYYENCGAGLDHYAGVLDGKGWTYGRHIAPHDIRVRELGTGKSRLEMAVSLGIRFDVCPNIPLADGINAVRAILPRCRFDAERCAQGLEALRHYRREYSERMNTFRPLPLHDWTSHATDAFRYLAVGFRPPRPGVLPERAVNDFDPFRRDV